MGQVLQWRVAADDHLVKGCLSSASLARLDGLSAKEPTRGLVAAYGPPSHQRAMCISRPRCKNSELTGARFALMHRFQLLYVSLGGRTRLGRLVDGHHLLFLV